MVKTHDEAVVSLKEQLPKIEETIITEAGRQEFAEITSALDAYLEVDEKILKLGATTDEAQSREAQELAFEELASAYAAAFEAIESLMNTNIALGDESHARVVRIQVIVLIVIVLIIIAACVIATRIGSAIAKGIAEPMNKLADRLETFAQGDLTTPFPEHDAEDEVGDMVKSVTDTTAKLTKIFEDLEQLLGDMADGNFNIATSCEEEYVGDYKPLLQAIRKMNRQMDETLKAVKDASDMVSAGALNLAEASQTLAEGATDQAASVEEMQAAIDGITSGLETTVDQVNAAYEEAKRVAAEAESSRAEMTVMAEAMNRISETSLKIGTVITEIEDIASQTNLLSLNASIEAARAGEAGRGFAVVADQIRTLAEQSAKAAVNTKELIEGSIHEVKIGNEATERTEKVLVGVVDAIQGIAKTSKNLSETSKQQAESMEQANAGVTRIADIVQSNSATAEETSATSEELSAQATSMDEIVSRFTLRS